MSDLSSSQKALAGLFAALVESLDEKKSGLSAAFCRNLELSEAMLQDHAGDEDVAAVFALTRELLDRDLDRTEPAAVVYAKSWVGDEEGVLRASEKIQFASLDEAVLFWMRLPAFERSRGRIETAAGRIYQADAVARLALRYKLG